MFISVSVSISAVETFDSPPKSFKLASIISVLTFDSSFKSTDTLPAILLSPLIVIVFEPFVLDFIFKCESEIAPILADVEPTSAVLFNFEAIFKPFELCLAFNTASV